MKKIGRLIIGGLQQKIFNLVLVTIILLVGAYTGVILYQTNVLSTLVAESGQKQLDAVQETTTATMDGVLKSSMGTSTDLEAYIADDVFRKVQGQVRMLGAYAQKLVDDPDAVDPVMVSRPDRASHGQIRAQLLTEEGVDLEDPGVAAKAGLIGNMAGMMEALLNNADLDSCFIGTPEGLFLITDDKAGDKFTEEGERKDYPVRSRFWYTGAAEAGELYFSEMEVDAFTGKIGIVCAMPIYADGKLEAVVGADLFLDSMAEAVAASGDAESGFVCIVNQQGHVIFSPQTEGIFQAKAADEAEDLRESGEEELAAFVRGALTGSTDVTLVHTKDGEYYMTGAPMETVGWAILQIVDAQSVRMPATLMQEQLSSISEEALSAYYISAGRSRQTILALIFLIFLMGTAAALSVAKRIVTPLNRITKRIASLGGNDLQFKMEDVYRTDDEIQVLAESFARLSAKTLQYVEQVKKVTAEKERIGTELELATQIQANILPRIFPPFPDRPELDLYAFMTPAKEVGGDFYDFFLIDDDHIGLVMADVSGKGVPAALFMMVAKTLIKNRVQSGESPSEVLANVNAQLLEGDQAQLFVTVWLGILEISTGKGVAANAGHEHPVIRRADGHYELVTYRHSPAVATIEGIRFREHEFQMYPGDSLFVYTDGVPEATNASEELFGTDRMLEALNRDPDADPENVLRNVMHGINGFVAGAEQFDDITMLCLQYRGFPEKAGESVEENNDEKADN